MRVGVAGKFPTARFERLHDRLYPFDFRRAVGSVALGAIAEDTVKTRQTEDPARAAEGKVGLANVAATVVELLGLKPMDCWEPSLIEG